MFELTDPVIHRKFETGGQQHKYGRTDRGSHGINNFYQDARLL
jgi:hypothetical protein